MINKELRDEKAVKTAIKRLHEGDYQIIRRPEGYVPEVVEEPKAEEEPIDLKSIFQDDEDEEEAEGEDLAAEEE